MDKIILISGIPSSGKTSLAKAIQFSELGTTHIPLDKYIMHVPKGRSFLDWVRYPSCIVWVLLYKHLDILRSDRPCFAPQPDWNNSGNRLSSGGMFDGSGIKMEPCNNGYCIPGTHAFSFNDAHATMLRIYMDTPYEVIASRLEKRTIDSDEEANRIVEKCLGDNLSVLETDREKADHIISGILPHDEQIKNIKTFLCNKIK